MLQRVGIAQALLNDPDLVIFDEPMSGLDPLGRRDVRSLILRLRDRGCTVLFSSHVLSDAEALCNRVAILAQGRLVAAGDAERDGVARRPRLGAGDVERLRRDSPGRGPRVRRIVRISEGRYALELPLDPAPERLLAELTAAGARLVSLNPIRDTLEDIFVQRVATARPRLQSSRTGAAHPRPESQAPGAPPQAQDLEPA